MLRRFVYLDDVMLKQYMATIDGGVIAETKTRSLQSGGGSGGADVKVLKGDYKRGHEDEHSWTITDTPEAQFERILAAANDNPEALDWLEIMDPETDFSEVTRGTPAGSRRPGGGQAR
jgi:hypothetical protein